MVCVVFDVASLLVRLLSSFSSRRRSPAPMQPVSIDHPTRFNSVWFGRATVPPGWRRLVSPARLKRLIRGPTIESTAALGRDSGRGSADWRGTPRGRTVSLRRVATCGALRLGFLSAAKIVSASHFKIHLYTTNYSCRNFAVGYLPGARFTKDLKMILRYDHNKDTSLR